MTNKRKNNIKTQKTIKTSEKYSEYKELIFSIFKKYPNKSFKFFHICNTLKAKDPKLKSIIHQVLTELLELGHLFLESFGNFKLKVKKEEYVGIVDHVSPDFAFIIIDGRDKDLKIRKKDLKGAFHGDTVKIVIDSWGNRIEEILKREKDNFVGKLIMDNKRNIVQLDGRRMHYNIYIDSNELKEANINDKVIVKILNWPTETSNANGKIERILGPSGNHSTEMSSIIYEYSLPLDFPREVHKEVENLQEQIPKEVIKERRDFRKISTFTIDPKNAKDYDDALSIRKLENGNLEVGIHVADVTYYVKEGTFIDKEAALRGNSVYLVDRTIPMLPEILSNKLCSLVEKEDRLTFSIVFEFDSNINIIDSWVGEGIINSNKRLVYEEAQSILDNESGNYFNELFLLNNISKKLRKRRFEDGSIAFNSPDYIVELDDMGNTKDIYKKKSIETNYLVEEFMLLANREVATKIHYLLKKKRKINTEFIYRIHDEPDPQKIIEFSNFLKYLGYKFNRSKNNLPSSFNKLNQYFEKRVECSLVQSFGIRTMARAIYSTRGSSHFGLAFEHYTHFTSPIRRYADLLVHRLLKKYLRDKFSGINSLELKETCQYLSNKERISAEAERTSIKFKQVTFLKEFGYKTFDGIISYITERALYVDLIDSGCGGVIPFVSIKGDYFEFNQQKFTAFGRKRGNKFSLGQKVKVKPKNCDIDKRSIEFELV